MTSGCKSIASAAWCNPRVRAIGVMLCIIVALRSSPVRADDVCLCFGGGGTVEAPPPTKMLADGKPFSVEMRFKAYAAVAQPLRAVSQWSDDPKLADASTFHLDLMPGNRLAFTMRVGKGRMTTVSSKEAWDLQRWHHVAVVWSGTDLTLYLDGKVSGQTHVDGAAVTASPLALVVGQAGAKRGQEGPGFKGFISDVAFWSVAPAADVIARHAEKGIDAGEQGLIARLPLRQAEAKPTTPESVSGQGAKISEGLARTGWCTTATWDAAAAAPVTATAGSASASAGAGVPLHLFSYDLSAPARSRSSSTADAVPVLSNPERMILLQNARTQQFGVLWQDRGTNGIYITWIDADFSGHETTRLKSMEDGILAAGCADPTGNLCYVEIQKVPASRDENTPLKAFLHGAAGDGKPLGEIPLDVTNAAGKGLNVWNYGGRWVGSMTYQKGAYAMILPRTMYKSPDGLNHQGAIAVVFPAKDPANYKNFGQITGHEFGNILTTNSTGAFLGLDLGDCYPRGVGLHRFTAMDRVSRVVFTFKTEHSTSPRNGSPKYDEISTDGKTYYKWSNDNNTYSELGAAIEGRVSYSVIFSTDRSTTGKVLDNSRAFHGCDDPRDLAMLRIIKDFEKAPDGNEVSDAILAGGMPAGANSESAGFYNFAANWTKQRETGVIWLTHHKSGEAAHAPHPVRQHDGSALILWEETSPEGQSLCATKVAEDGKVLAETAMPGSTLHLNREEPVAAVNGRDYFLATDPSAGNNAKLCFVYEDFPIGVPAATKSSGAGKTAAAK